MIDGKVDPKRRGHRIPAGRLERLARVGWMAGEVAAGGLAEGVRRLTRDQAGASSVFATAANARRLARRLSRMRGAAMKLGQLLSLEGEDLLPPEVAQALAVLRSDAEPMPEAQLRRVLAQEYGRDWRRRFAHFDFEPIAAASIGQVHEAVLPDGSELALKVQYPGIAQSIASDVSNLVSLLRWSRLLPAEVDLHALGNEAERQLHEEADYLGEAGRLRRYRELLADEPGFVVPAVYPELTTRRILAMERLRGRPLEDLCGPEHPQALRDQIGASLYRLLFRELFDFTFMQTDPNLANYLWLGACGRMGLVDLGAGRSLPRRLSRLYARLFRAGMERDRAALRRVAIEIGFFPQHERADRIEGVLDLLLLGCEPFAKPGLYDFGRSELTVRMRELGTELTFERGFFRPPPIETLHLHRKLGGTFLLCARLGARVGLRDLIEPHLERCLAQAA